MSFCLETRHSWKRLPEILRQKADYSVAPFVPALPLDHRPTDVTIKCHQLPIHRKRRAEPADTHSLHQANAEGQVEDVAVERAIEGSRKFIDLAPWK
jgi:hypothetical protein